MKIAILGCGPAGLMSAQAAADAAERSGIPLDLAIFSKARKSRLFGAQYLHEPIPGVTPGEGRHIAYRLRGEPDDYRRKVYGPLWSGSVSPEDLLGEHMGWDIRATYDRLWERWSPFVTDVAVDPITLRSILTGNKPYKVPIASRIPPDLLINSMPRPSLCYTGHVFGSVTITAAGDAPDLGIRVSNMFQSPDDMVTCNAEDNPSWYRLSRVFGYTTIEWPPGVRVPVTSASEVHKPTRHDCDCWADDPVMHVGRYGRWEKGVLSHSAYKETYKRIDEMIGVLGGTSAEG